MFTVTKEVYFCYGHRLLDHAGKCRHVHGHSVKAAISVSAARLNQQAMVCDFAEISAVAAEYIETHLDHTLLLHRSDPLIPVLAENRERFLALEDHPTAESIAKLIFNHLRQRGLQVTSVTLWETASAYATYSEAPTDSEADVLVHSP